MLKIYKPKIIKTDTGVRIQSVIEQNQTTDTLWYEVEKQYGRYLTDETADGFLVGLLFYALKNGDNIEVLAHVSEKLFYSINHYLVPLLVRIHGYTHIKITCNNLMTEPIHNHGAVGTGLSCGIDSFATIIDHLKSNCPENYRITHYTFFNVGSHGDNGGEKARRLFKERADITRQYAEEYGNAFVMVDSNLSELLKMDFRKTNTLRSLSAVLVLQKLFNIYYYSSSVPLYRFKLKQEDSAGFDIFNTSMLSTESVRFFSTCPMMTRVEKTRLVSDFAPSYKYLNVCFFSKHNCGKCPKCLRTLLTLDIIGKIEKYKEVFDLEAYYSHKNRFIAAILTERKFNPTLNEIYEEMEAENISPPLSSRAMCSVYKISNQFKRRFMGKGRYTKLKNALKV